MQQAFHDLADRAIDGLEGEEVLLLSYAGEASDFARLSSSKVRQGGHVNQGVLSLELILGQRHTRSVVTLTGNAGEDAARARRALGELREMLAHVPEDPHLHYATEVRSGESVGENRLPDRADALDALLAAGDGRDMVGLYAAGAIERGFANSLGQRNWFARHTFHADWSFYLAGDKAVKTSYAGFEWDAGDFRRTVDEAAAQLDALARPAVTVEPGAYRVYLAPAAVAELMETVAWGGFGLKAHRTKSTSLLRMVDDGVALDGSVTVRENTADGLASPFTDHGFVKPGAVTLIDRGRYAGCLVGPRSAKEYGEPCNAGGEYPESLEVAAGALPGDEVLERLEEGVYVSRLWYLNYSDRPACRITGMTRFATLWVRGGEIVGPMNVMRFDETIYRVLGENLLGLTDRRELLPSAETYEARSTDSMRVPGALVEGFRFTL